MTSPVQIVFCESGMLPFKTSLLPVFPYSSLNEQEIETLIQIIEKTKCTAQRETMETSGQYTLTIHQHNGNSTVAGMTDLQHKQHKHKALPPLQPTDLDPTSFSEASSASAASSHSTAVAPLMVCKKKVLINFIQIMLHDDNAYLNGNACKTLCNIILQRLMARVPIPSNIIASVVECIQCSGHCQDDIIYSREEKYNYESKTKPEQEEDEEEQEEEEEDV